MIRNLSLLCLSGLLGLWVLGCTNKKTQTSAAKKPAPVQKNKLGLDRGHPDLAKGLRAMSEKCQVSASGIVRRCKDDAKQALLKLEEEKGKKVALMTYCHGLSDKDQATRTLSAAQLRRLCGVKMKKEDADPETLACLLEALGSIKDVTTGRTVARSAVTMATVLGRETEALKILESHPVPTIKSSGYGALWPSGRMRVFDRVAKIIKEGDQSGPRVEVINSFVMGGELNDEETKAICELLSAVLSDEDVVVSARAASRIAISCPEKKEQVLEAAEKMIEKGAFQSSFVSAVRHAAVSKGKAGAGPGLKRRALILLIKVVASERIQPFTRASALRTIRTLDDRAGILLAKKHIKSKNRYLRQAAEKILEPTESPR